MAAIFFATCAHAQDHWPSADWPRPSSPDRAEHNAVELSLLDADITGGKYGYVDSLLVIRNGYLIYSKMYQHDYHLIYGDDARRIGPLNSDPNGPYNYFNSDWHPFYKKSDLHTLQSVTKSVTSVVIGVAMARNEFHIDLDAPILPFFGKGRVNRLDERKQRITLRHLLTMTAGLDWNEELPYKDPKNSCTQMEASTDWVQFVMDRPMAFEPGTVFTYNCGLSQLLSYLFQKATGNDIEEYARQHLFVPLGIERYYWKRTRADLIDTEGGLYLRAQDIARIGYLFLRNGSWGNERLLEPAWVEASVAPSIKEARPGLKYGFQWWLAPYGAAPERFAWVGSGFGGQKLILVPEFDLVVVFTGWNIDQRLSLSTREAVDRALRLVSAH